MRTFIPAPSRTRNFTLVELLVVVAVIAILAGLLLPALGKAKDMAKRSSCANNLKQQCLGIYSYVDDYSGWMPPATMGGHDATLKQIYRTLVIDGSDADNYSKGYIPIRLLDCSADTTRTPQVDFWPYYGVARNWTSYGYNGPVGGGKDGAAGVGYRQISQFLRPSSDILVAELEPGDLYYGSFGTDPSGNPGRKPVDKPRHGKGMNHLFLDGSVAWFTGLQYLNELRFQGDQYYDPNWGNVSVNYRPY